MHKLKIIKEFLEFLLVRKKWWLIPIAVLLCLLSLIVFVGQNPIVHTFIYTIF